MRLFAYRLAKELGYPNPDTMMDEMGPSHMNEWMALGLIEREEQLQREAAARVEARMQRRT